MKKSYSRKMSLLPLALILCAAPALAAVPALSVLPTGGQVTAGQAAISQSGSAMTINQSTDKAILNWQSFDIGSQATVRFSQPAASAVALNRVLAGEASQIYGNLSANGQVYLVNPAGIVFGPGSRVDVGGLVASTLNITDADFLAGNRTFSRNNATGSITNQGQITAADGGLIALLAPTVVNEGVITARLGNVALAAGDKITLAAGADGLLQLAIDPATLQTLIDNRQLIVADGGQVLMTSKAADALSAGVVANSGTIQARTLQEHEGRILLLADMAHGEVNFSGSLDASPPPPLPLAGEGAGERANGGFVETSAAQVRVADTACVTTLAADGQNGLWLIDPNDYTIAVSGGNISGATLSANLAGGNVAINTATQGTAGGNGDIFVNDAVSWNASILTLTAERDININAVMTASGASVLAMNPTGTVKVGFAPGEANGFAGRVDFPGRSGAGFLTIKGVGYTVLNSLGAQGSVTGADLQGMNGNLAGKYALGANIDACATSGWNAGAGFLPVGTFDGFITQAGPGGVFTGIFDGLGHVISGLTINRPVANPIPVGLFGGVSGLVRNVGSQGGTITGGDNYVGGLVGINWGPINNSYATGSVGTGSIIDGSMIGGLVGYQVAGGISNAYATGNVTGNQWVGGLVGGGLDLISNAYAIGSVSGVSKVGGLVGVHASGSGLATISNVYATGNVTGNDRVGGLMGWNMDIITNSSATGNVTGVAGNIGGLIGFNEGTVSNSFASGAVTGSAGWIGGLVGQSTTGSTISDSYATGAVAGTDKVGGLVGWNTNGSSISRSYATGSVSGTTDVGGLAGSLADGGGGVGTVVDSFWNTQTTGQATSAGGTGLTTAQMKQQASFAGWDISATGGGTSVWRIYEGQTAPLLRRFLTPLTVTASNDSKTYNGLAYSGGNGVTYSISGAGASPNLLGTLAYNGNSQGAINTGSYVITPASLYSNQQGYDISYANGTLATNPASLTVSANNDNKAYDGNAYSGGNGVAYTGFVNGETAAVLGGALAYGGNSQGAINAGSYAITPSGRTATNYTITFANGTLAINPVSLTVTANNDSKTYDGNAYSGGNGVGYAGFVNGETAAVLGGALAYGGASQGAINAGSYAIIPSGRTATNYTITFVNGALTITGAAQLPVPTITPVADATPATPNAIPNGGLLWRNTQMRETEPAGQRPSDQPASPPTTPTIEVAQLHGPMENRLLYIPPSFIRLQEE